MAVTLPWPEDAHYEELKAEREQEKLDAAKPVLMRCMFCHETASPDRLLVGNEGSRFGICEACVAAPAHPAAKIPARQSSRSAAGGQ